jgi:hypothetical protein
MGSKRGQGSTEYLVIMGAVLAIGLVSVTLMVALPSFGETAKEQQFSQYWMRATPFKISIAKLSSGNISFSLSNAAKKTMTLTGIELGTDTQVIQFWTSGSQSFRPGQEMTIANESFGVSGNPCYGKALGTYYELKNISLIYTEGSVSGMRQVGQGLAGRCSGVDEVSPATVGYPGFATLSGYVRNASGTAIYGAIVNLTNSTTPQYAVTDNLGYYLLNVSLGAEATTFTVNASAWPIYRYTTGSVFLINQFGSTLDFTISSATGGEYLLYIKDPAGSNAAAFTTIGDIVLKGGCYPGASGSCSSPPDGSFVIRDSSGTSHAFINSSGGLCIEDSDCNYFDANCNGAPEGSLIVRSADGTNATYISPTGALCTIGEVRQYGTP